MHLREGQVINSWEAEAMGVKFVAQGNNSNRIPDWASNLEPYNYQADA